MLIKRRFIDGAYGQIHLRIASPETPQHRPLACLHMSPKSGRLFSGFLERASDDRIIIAHDYPGFGESAPPPSDPAVTIDDYARSLWQVADALDLGKIDLLGYHTGSEVAVEVARQRPGGVGSIILVGAPVFTPDELEHMKQTFSEIPLDVEGTRFRKMWESVIAHRGPGTTLEMLSTSFAENLRAGENYEWGHRAAFAYASEFVETVRGLPHRITVFNPADDLSVFTPRIAPHLKNGEIIEFPDWGHGFLDAFPEDAIRAVKSAL